MTDEEISNPKESGEDLDEVVLKLAEHFGRFPSDNEVHRFIFGDDNARQRIWDKKGLPEALR